MHWLHCVLLLKPLIDILRADGIAPVEPSGSQTHKGKRKAKADEDGGDEDGTGEDEVAKDEERLKALLVRCIPLFTKFPLTASIVG